MIKIRYPASIRSPGVRGATSWPIFDRPRWFALSLRVLHTYDVVANLGTVSNPPTEVDDTISTAATRKDKRKMPGKM